MGSSVSLIFCKAWTSAKMVGRVDMLLILNDGTEYLRTRGAVREVYFNSLPELKPDGNELSLSAQSEIVSVKVADRETIYFSIPRPCSCKVLDLLGFFHLQLIPSHLGYILQYLDLDIIHRRRCQFHYPPCRTYSRQSHP